MKQLSTKAKLVLDNLRKGGESDITIAGQKWSQVYLDNARPEGMSARSFAGYLTVLTARGFYRSQGDDCFGNVKMED